MVLGYFYDFTSNKAPLYAMDAIFKVWIHFKTKFEKIRSIGNISDKKRVETQLKINKQLRKLCFMVLFSFFKKTKDFSKGYINA